jgi:hypothetical protein
MVEMIGALMEQYGDQHLAVKRRQPKKWTQGDGGSRKKLATTHRQMTRHAILMPCKGHGHQGSGRNNVARGAPTGRMLSADNRHARNAAVEYETKTSRSSYIWEVRGHPAGSSGRLSCWRSWSEESSLQSRFEKRVTGHCGEVNPLWNERRDH